VSSAYALQLEQASMLIVPVAGPVYRICIGSGLSL